MDSLTGAQLIGMIIGGIVGYGISATIAGGSWQHVGGGWFEAVKDPMGCFPGCLVTLLATAAGVGAGWVVGSFFS